MQLSGDLSRTHATVQRRLVEFVANSGTLWHGFDSVPFEMLPHQDREGIDFLSVEQAGHQDADGITGAPALEHFRITSVRPSAAKRADLRKKCVTVDEERSVRRFLTLLPLALEFIAYCLADWSRSTFIALCSRVRYLKS